MLTRPTQILLFAFLGLFVGCNGCDSCMSKQPGDVVPSAEPAPTLPPIQPRIVDAAPEEEESADAAPPEEASTNEPTVNVPAMSAVPRPSDAPMPMGAFQSCGVYDGPLCEKTCAKGNCRQECEGVTCELSCAGGYCSQHCGKEGTCRMTCKGGHCVQVCAKKDGCVKECAGGDCR